MVDLTDNCPECGADALVEDVSYRGRGAVPRVVGAMYCEQCSHVVKEV